MGGGFGSKSSAGNYARAAVALSRAAGAPVRLVLDRHEEQLDFGNRPGTFQRLKIGARKDGTLSAISLYTYGTAGTAIGAGVGNVAQAMYAVPEFRYRAVRRVHQCRSRLRDARSGQLCRAPSRSNRRSTNWRRS